MDFIILEKLGCFSLLIRSYSMGSSTTWPYTFRTAMREAAP